MQVTYKGKEQNIKNPELSIILLVTKHLQLNQNSFRHFLWAPPYRSSTSAHNTTGNAFQWVGSHFGNWCQQIMGKRRIKKITIAHNALGFR